MDANALWNRVKSLSKEKGVTQAELAKACRFSLGTLRGWMSKKYIPPLNYAHRIARYFGVSLEYLISGRGRDRKTEVLEEILTLLKTVTEKLNTISKQ